MMQIVSYTRRRGLLGALALLPVLLLPALALLFVPHAADAECRLQRAASLPITIEGGHPLVQASINGHTVNMVLDTGAQATLVTPAAAARLGLPTDRRRSTNLIGIGGSVLSQNVLIRDFALAGSERLDLSVVVSALPASDRTDGLIGADMLSVYDLDLDFPGRMLTLYTVSGCERIVPPWNQRYAPMPAQFQGRLLVVQVEIDGHQLSAMFDSGGAGVMLSREAAPLVGVGVGDTARDRMEDSRGVGARLTSSSVHRFAAMRIGAEIFHNVPVRIADLHQVQANMLLGLDYMIGRRFWLSYATHSVLIQLPARPGP